MTHRDGYTYGGENKFYWLHVSVVSLATKFLNLSMCEVCEEFCMSNISFPYVAT